MKKNIMITALAMVAMAVQAQETYENAKIAAGDLNGTARYVGMGGAMEALGADISTIGTNPAGIGLFRKSNASVSFGIVSQGDGKSAVGGNKTNVSFDQAGFVYSSRLNKTSFVNFAFNYHKSRNFNYILSATDRQLNHASQNKLTFAKAKVSALSIADGGDGLLYKQDAQTPIVQNNEIFYVPDFRNPYITCNQLDEIYARNLNFDENGNWIYGEADSYQFDRAHKGYISDFDFNLSGNINNRVYLGLTIGIHDVHYKHYGEYVENAVRNIYYTTDQNGNTIADPGNPYDLTVCDSRTITGTGYDVKAGIIIRPVEASPFRIGLSVATPTFYKLTTSNYTTVSDGSHTAASTGNIDAPERTSYEYKLYTPWKFGLSLGHTIGNNVALGLSYEYADYGSMDTRYITGEYYDEWGDSYSTRSTSDNVMNNHTERTLKGVHTLKLGAEYKPEPSLAIRLGYNYVSPMYNRDGFKDGTLSSDASYISSATDYTNWEDTHRFTCGVGYTFNKFNISLAYQYTTTSGKFHPFMNYVDDDVIDYDNVADEVKVNNNRHQLLMTLGYTF